MKTTFKHSGTITINNWLTRLHRNTNKNFKQLSLLIHVNVVIQRRDLPASHHYAISIPVSAQGKMIDWSIHAFTDFLVFTSQYLNT